MAAGVRFARLALIGLVVLVLVSCRSGLQGSASALPSQSPASSESALASASASARPIDPTPSPTPIQPTLGGWQVIDLAIDDGYAYAVAESGNGWVAVGHGPYGPGDPRIWHSADGVSWSQVLDVPDKGGGLYEVMVGGPGFIATGTTADIDFGAPYAWTSTDGLAWESSDLNADRPAEGILTGTSLIDGYLLAGGGLMGEGGPDHGPAVVWRSADGKHWVETTLDSGGVEGIDVRPPVAFDGHLVGIGSGYLPRVARVWFSSDGVDWQLQPDDPVWVDAYVWDVAVVNGHLVVVGGVWPDNEKWEVRPAIWTSDDARSWTMQYLGPCCTLIQQVAATGSGGLAFAGSLVYSSTDGLSWNLAGTIEGFHGDVTAVVETLTYGQVAVGTGPEGATVLLIPPEQMTR